jgi:hypothetical protein
LLLEPWMTPSIFSKFNVGSIAGKVYDEWTVAQYVDRNVAKEVLEKWVLFSGVNPHPKKKKEILSFYVKNKDF